MKRENEKIAKELDCKLDRLELDPLKEYIEKQIKKIKKLQVSHLSLNLFFYYYLFVHIFRKKLKKLIMFQVEMKLLVCANNYFVSIVYHVIDQLKQYHNRKNI